MYQGQIVHTAPSTTTNLAGTTTTTSGTTSGGATNLGAITVSTAGASLSPSLTYNSTTGAFTYTPPDLSQYTTTANLASVALNGDYYSLTNRPTIPGAITDNTQIANGRNFISKTDISASTVAASGTGNLTYNSSTGVFEYTPPDLSGFLTSETISLSDLQTALTNSTTFAQFKTAILALP